METQTESSTNDVSEDQLPDWLVGVIVVIVLLVLAVIILIITTFIKNRSKSRSNMFSTTVCDDLESGKIGHNIDSTTMTSLTSIPNSINDAMLLSHSVAVSAEYDQQIPSPTSADVIYGVLGCRNPLFVDDEIGTEEKHNNSRTLASIDELDSVDLASSSDDLPSTSNDYLEYEATSENKMTTLYVRKTSMYHSKLKQMGKTRRLSGGDCGVHEINSFDSKFLPEREASETGSLDNKICSLENEKEDHFQETSEYGEDGLASIADRNNLEDINLSGCFNDEGVRPGSGHGSLSVTTGSSNGLCDTGDDLVTNCPQSVSVLSPPRLQADVISPKNVHFIESESPAAVRPRECGDEDDDDDGDDEVNDLSRPVTTSEDVQCPGFVSVSHKEKESEMCVYTTSRQEESSHSSTTQAGELEDHNPSHGATASADQSLDVASTFAEGNPPSSLVVPTLAVPTFPAATPTSVSAESTENAATPTSVSAESTANDATPTSVSAESTLNAATPSSVSAESTANAATPSSVSAESMANVAMSTSVSAVPTQTLPSPTLTRSTPTLTRSTPTLTRSTLTPATEGSILEIQATAEPAQCQRSNEIHKQNINNGLEVSQQMLANSGVVTSSPTIVEVVNNQDIILDPSNRILDPSNSQDLVASDDVNLQTPGVTRPGSDTEDVSLQMKGCADIFNVHL